MKQKSKPIICAINLTMMVSSVLLFCSCELSLFNSPQPIDTKNIYEFPKQFRGSWITDGEHDTLIIEKDHFIMTHQEPTKIINGAYVNPVDTMNVPEKGDTTAWKKHSAANKFFESLQSIQYDSLKNPIDTATNYIIKESKIYKIEDILKPGFPFVSRNDTIYTRVEELFYQFDLGRHAFLRQVSENRYIVNISEGSSLHKGSIAGWWMVFLLEKDLDGKMYIREINHHKIPNSEVIYSDGDDLYLDSQWTKKDLVRLIQEDLFDQKEPLEKIENK